MPGELDLFAESAELVVAKFVFKSLSFASNNNQIWRKILEKSREIMVRKKTLNKDCHDVFSIKNTAWDLKCTPSALGFRPVATI